MLGQKCISIAITALYALFFSSLLLNLLCTSSASGMSSGQLSAKYRFAKMLDGAGDYWLHWSFDMDNGTIAFAVNVSTTGWVGFGLSPNGQMPQSDVVIGWVDSAGNAQFQDRFAVGRYEPKIDANQDWTLTGHMEKGGRTVMEFSRDMTTCDKRDIDITAATARVIWSWGSNDPTSVTGLARHTNQGSTSINLLGKLNKDPAVPADESYFEIRHKNLTIPSNKDTTYWCRLFPFPGNILSQEHYVYKISPVLTPHMRQYVHHMVIFLCPVLPPPFLPPSMGFSGDCNVDATPYITLCTNTKVLGSWAVGGEDFIFPQGVAFPIGGAANEQYVVLEMHYDNPNLTPDIVDSSGMRFYYTQTAPTHRASVLIVGHHITELMIIPPTTGGYVTSGICTSSCTEKFIPPEGITVFANIFHTHLIGRGLTLRHYTKNDTTCNGWKELEPIDENPNYDFNYQQINILQRERKILPGDSLELECLYKTNRTGVTLGGDGTTEEMCLSFVAYYPEIRLSACVSRPSLSSMQKFTNQYLPAGMEQEVLTNLQNTNASGIRNNFNRVQWKTANAVGDLQNSVRSGNITEFCIVHLQDPSSNVGPGSIPTVECPYQPPAKQCPTPTSLGLRMTPQSVLLLVAFMLAMKLFHPFD